MFRAFPMLWPRIDPPPFERPMREVGYSMPAVVAVLIIGQLYTARLPLPAPDRQLMKLFLNALNQALIFSPMFLLLLVRRQGVETAWLPRTRVGVRVLAGLVLAQVAIAEYLVARTGNQDWRGAVRHVYDPARLLMLVQVFGEDVGVAIVFMRLRAAWACAWRLGLSQRCLPPRTSPE